MLVLIHTSVAILSNGLKMVLTKAVRTEIASLCSRWQGAGAQKYGAHPTIGWPTHPTAEIASLRSLIWCVVHGAWWMGRHSLFTLKG